MRARPHRNADRADIRLDHTTKHQVLFRSDDGSLLQHELEDRWRELRRGDVVRVTAGKPLNPAECEGKDYPISQGLSMEIVERYTGKAPFVQEQAMGTKVVKTTTVRIQNRRIRTQNPLDPHPIHDKKPQPYRAFLFAQWLVDNFGADFLRSGSGVVDVAAGKGDVSMFLCYQFGIPSTLVEPKTRKVSKWWRRRIEKMIKEAKEEEGDSISAKEAIESDSREPNHDSNADSSTSDDIISFPDPVPLPSSTSSTSTERFSLTPSHIASHLDASFLVAHAELLQTCSVLIGMHPDQATEPIVDVALRLDKPFAVVPCCVFGHENRHRRLKDGGKVVTTEEFVKFLVEKKEGVKTEWLGFEGSNSVVYIGGRGSEIAKAM
ncbi:hypothetical protein BC937DRAFT_90121 [Endogone sp. FLAS-F59071]|nr:hypothetical protein BC937DRAFT_90121 [Endogone sp. FLAS-F59071]|eukprot:RUS22166.1 hypothetical protein BC937DRAFT_90121 [Endogone sp. FLAS-F59071]